MFCGNITPVCGYIAHSLGFIIRNIGFDKLYIMLLLIDMINKSITFSSHIEQLTILQKIKFDVGVKNGWINLVNLVLVQTRIFRLLASFDLILKIRFVSITLRNSLIDTYFNLVCKLI